MPPALLSCSFIEEATAFQISENEFLGMMLWKPLGMRSTSSVRG